MPIARFQMPDGRIARFEVPDGTTPDQAQSMMEEHFAPKAAPPAETEKPSALAQMVSNIPGSAARFAGGIFDAVTSPVQTVKGLADMAAGGLRNLAPQSIRGFIDRADNPETTQRISGAADAAGQFYKDRYGGMENIKRTAIEDPVGALADVSTLLAGGGMLARGASMPRVSGALSRASDLTNPLSVVKPAVNGIGTLSKNVLGLSTGTGAENISQAVKAGRTGDPGFMANLKGDAPLTDVLTKAKEALSNMGAQKSAEYRSNMAAVKSDATVLKFDGIDKAIQDAAGVAAFKGVVKNERAAAAVQKMADDVATWKQLDPAEFHTPEGLDALKQRLGGTLEGIPFEEKSARLAAGKIYSSVKDEIVKQAPVYAKTMKQYEEASDAIREIERALSLGQKASADTAMRKLQSLTRNNVQTNYGNRLKLAEELMAKGGVDILPAVAGQAMNSWTPRSLTGQAGGMATLGGSLAGNPGLAALLPFQSPKAVGLGAYGLGATQRGLLGVGLTPELLTRGGLLSGAADRWQEDR
jgi:hypothetical protein